MTFAYVTLTGANGVEISGHLRRRSLTASFEVSCALKRGAELTDGDVTWVVRSTKGDDSYTWAELVIKTPKAAKAAPAPAPEPDTIDIEEAIEEAAAVEDEDEDEEDEPPPPPKRKRKGAADAGE